MYGNTVVRNLLLDSIAFGVENQYNIVIAIL